MSSAAGGGTPTTSAFSGFVKSVAVLLSGTMLAHGITALALPVLTRLYTPADFNLLAVFSSAAAVLAVAVCLRFDIAVSIPEQDDDALTLLAMALACAAGLSAVMGACVLLAPGPIAGLLRQPALAPYLWLLPLTVFVIGAYSTLQNWNIRRKAFTLLARTRIAQSAASAGVQIGSGLAGLTPGGLLVGYAMNAGAASIALGALLRRQVGGPWLRASCSRSRVQALWSQYRRFPVYSTWESLANSAAIQVPVVLIGGLASAPEAGFLMLAMSVIQAPMALFGGAIGQVYLSHAPAEFRAGRLGTYTVEVVTGLLKAGVGPIVAVGLISPVAFSTVFGPDWARAGWLVAWMTPWFVLQFLATPVSMAIHVTGHQRAAMVLQVSGLLLRVLSVVGAARLAGAPVSEAYAVSGWVFYGAYFVVTLRCAGAPLREIAGSLRRSAPILLAWTGAAVAAAASWSWLEGVVRSLR